MLGELQPVTALWLHRDITPGMDDISNAVPGV